MSEIVAYLSDYGTLSADKADTWTNDSGVEYVAGIWHDKNGKYTTWAAIPVKFTGIHTILNRNIYLDPDTGEFSTD